MNNTVEKYTLVSVSTYNGRRMLVEATRFGNTENQTSRFVTLDEAEKLLKLRTGGKCNDT